MGLSCSRSAYVDIIPDREVMIGIVDRILEFEEMLKQGQPLSASDGKRLKQIKRVTSEMKRVNTEEMRERGVQPLR